MVRRSVAWWGGACTHTQLGALVLGCIVNFDNHALGELDLVPNSCLTFDTKSVAAGGVKDEAGFDEL